MKKLFVIPGFTKKSSDARYRWIRRDLGDRYDIEFVNIHWKYRVMSDYVEEFKEAYEKRKARTNYVLGFSFGAMTALLSAGDLKPNKLFLCSLSPYFKNDLPYLKDWWNGLIGKHRLKDFKTHDARRAAKATSMPTTLFIGEKEVEKFPRMKSTYSNALRNLPNGTGIIVPDAPHDIAHPNYRSAILKCL